MSLLVKLRKGAVVMTWNRAMIHNHVHWVRLTMGRWIFDDIFDGEWCLRSVVVIGAGDIALWCMLIAAVGWGSTTVDSSSIKRKLLPIYSSIRIWFSAIKDMMLPCGPW